MVIIIVITKIFEIITRLNEQHVKTLGVVERVSPAWSSVVHASKIAKRTKVLITMIMSMRMISSSF